MRVKLPEFVRQIIQKFTKAGYQIYIVGGAVRDILMEKEVGDWDFTTNATPQEILTVFPDGFYNNRFGTVAVADKMKKTYEITTFRREIGYSDKRHPDKVVWGKTLAEDLARRDFTINAIALKLSHITSHVSPITIIDPFHGQKDLEVKIVRAVGDPTQRFSEDALRMIRAIRIATEIGFTIEPQTFAAIKENATFINQIAKERVRDELFKILATNFPADGFMLLRNGGLLREIIPPLEKAFEIPQQSPGRHHLWDVGTHSLLSLKFCLSNDPVVRLATLIHDLGKVATFKKHQDGSITFYNHEVVGTSIAQNLAERLRLSKKQREKLVTLVRWHQFTVDERQTDSAIRRFIRNVGKENLQEMLNLRIGDRLGGGAQETSWRLEKFKKRLIEVQKQPFTVADLKVDGHDVMEILGLKPGPKVGQILNQLFEEVVEEKKKNERKYLLPRIKELSQEQK